MVKKYIRGHATRGAEVIKELEKLGGKTNNQIGNRVNSIYFINENNDIVYFNSDIKWVCDVISCFEEIILPPVFEPEEYETTINFFTAQKTNGCDGCVFHGNKFCYDDFDLPNCTEKNIIYKQKF